MLRHSLLLRCAAASAGGAANSATSASSTAEPPTLSPEGRATLHTLYRRLLECGEEGAMMQHTLSTHTLQEAVRYGTKLLGTHRALTQVDIRARELSALRHPLQRLRLAGLRRKYAWTIFWTRVTLRSKNALSDALVYTLFIVTCVLLFEIYRACRIGVNRAEERYRTMAIPILQTFDALEAMEERKRILQKEMEEDIIRQRG